MTKNRHQDDVVISCPSAQLPTPRKQSAGDKERGQDGNGVQDGQDDGPFVAGIERDLAHGDAGSSHSRNEGGSTGSPIGAAPPSRQPEREVSWPFRERGISPQRRFAERPVSNTCKVERQEYPGPREKKWGKSKKSCGSGTRIRSKALTGQLSAHCRGLACRCGVSTSL